MSREKKIDLKKLYGRRKIKIPRSLEELEL